MPVSAEHEVAIQVRKHSRGWLLVPVRVPLLPGSVWELKLMLNTGRPQSAIDARLGTVLAAAGLIEPLGGAAYRLNRPIVQGQALPPLVLRVSAGPSLLRLDGMLGLDFLDQFAGMHLDMRSLRLTLIR
jgi:hypothetical protein